MNKPELIIFDLGKVLLDFDFKIVVRGLAQYSPKNQKEIREWFKQTPLWDRFERGLESPEQFFNQLSRELDLSGLNYPSFRTLWNHIFEENKDTVALLEQLKRRFRLAMISNVNQMHWEFVRERYPFLHWFDVPVASFAVGHRKPEPAIYHKTLELAAVRPEQSVFIDDIHAHILAAEALGMRAHQFISAGQLREDLADLL